MSRQLYLSMLAILVVGSVSIVPAADKNASAYKFMVTLQDHVVNPPAAHITHVDLTSAVDDKGKTVFTVTVTTKDDLPFKTGDLIQIRLDPLLTDPFDHPDDPIPEISVVPQYEGTFFVTVIAHAETGSTFSYVIKNDGIKPAPLGSHDTGGRASEPLNFTQKEARIVKVTLASGTVTVFASNEMPFHIGDFIEIHLDPPNPDFDGTFVLTGADPVEDTFQYQLANPPADQTLFTSGNALGVALAPVGDVLSGILSGVIKIDPSIFLQPGGSQDGTKIINVNKKTRNDDLAGMTVTIEFPIRGDKPAIKVIGNLATLTGTADEKGVVQATFQGQFIANGTKFKFFASNLNLQGLLRIPYVTDQVKLKSKDPIKTDPVEIKISAKGVDPDTGNPINVTLSDEIVTFTYKVQTRPDTQNIDNDPKTTDLPFKARGTGAVAVP